ncbi:MAG: Flp pilus assembly complex ATPase component TadA, partial [Sedimentisphaerales bacterium]|nr:Flp pilus assembly complex ATPase component TadA [Sedimentisphaerales bacterium]
MMMTQSRQTFNTVAIVDDILARGAQCRASDIHFEPGVGHMSIKFRLDGCLQVVEQLPAAISENIITRLKVMASLLTYRNDIPQEGRIELATGNTDMIEQRISTFPTIHGQRAVVRLFYCDTGLDHLNELGLPVALAIELQKLVSQNQGVLLLTGPAGSGKTTTLAALLRYIQSEFPGKSIVTLEDPVERHIEGITQVQISQNSELTFPLALRSLLRQDPQVLMVGEIRDSETAKIVIEAGLSGHLLLSTMHSGSPAGAFLRLLEMGIEPYQITSAVMAVLNQRLLRKLCLDCRQESAGGFSAAGCAQWLHIGYKGR